MEQYEKGSTTPKTVTSPGDSSGDQIRQLQKITQEQQADIQDLRTEIRRLRNELRVAVNAFNQRSHG